MPLTFLFALTCVLFNPQEGSRNISVWVNPCTEQAFQKDWGVLLHETLYRFMPQFSNWIHLHMSICQLLHVYAKQYFCNKRVISIKVLRLELLPVHICLTLQYSLTAFGIHFMKGGKWYMISPWGFLFVSCNLALHLISCSYSLSS